MIDEMVSDAYRGAELLKMRSLNRGGFDARANLIEPLGELAEAMVSLASFGDLFNNVCGKRDFDATRQGGFPLDQMPFVASVQILAALNEGCLDTDLCPQQMLPLVPTRIPQQGQRCLVEECFQFVTRIPIDGVIVIKRGVSQGRTEVFEPLPGEKRKDARSVKRRSIS